MRYVEELKLQELQVKLAGFGEIHPRETSLSLEKCIEEYPIEVIFLICKNICFEEGSARNCFYNATHTAHGGLRSQLSKWNESAMIIINHIEFRGEGKKKEYASLVEFIENECDLNRDWVLRAKRECANDRHSYYSGYQNILAFADHFFQIFVEEIQRLLYYICWLIYRGLPIYEKTTMDKFIAVSNSNKDYVYLFMNGLYRTCPIGQPLFDRPRAPIKYHQHSYILSLVANYFINNNQLLFFKEFFHDYDVDDERTTKLRRKAFRNAIGLEDVFVNLQDNSNKKSASNGKPEEGHQTRLMEIQQKVLQRYYGSQFSLNDRDTWTSQTDIVDWLQKEFKLSKREAEAIDITTRPDTARGK